MRLLLLCVLFFAGAAGLASAAPTSPANLTATPSTSSVQLRWTLGTEPNLCGYLIYNGDYSRLYAWLGKVNTYTVPNLQPGTSYTFQLRAFDCQGAVSTSSSATTTTLASTALKADFTYSPIQAVVGRPTTFDASISTGDIVSYKWELVGSDPPITSTSKIFVHSWQYEGTKHPRLTVTDRQGQTSVIEKSLTAIEATATPAPTATTGPAPGPTPAGSGAVLWNGDLSTGNLSQYKMEICRSAQAAVIRDPLGVNRNAMRLTATNSDACITENPRAQALSPSILKPGGEYWYGVSIMVPTDFPVIGASGDNWISVMSVYGPPFSGSGPGLGMGLDANASSGPALFNRRNATHNYDEPWRMRLTKGKWIDVVNHIKLSSDPSVGFRELYINTGNGWQQQLLKGQKRLYFRTLDSSNSGGNNHFKVSLYYKRGIMSSASLYFASAKIGTSFQAVAPRSY